MENYSYQELIANVVTWAEARNLIAGSNPAAQFLKLMEEHGEYLLAVEALAEYRRDPAYVNATELAGIRDEMKDAIGDTAVVLIIIAAQEGVVDKLPPIADHRRVAIDYALTMLAVALQDRSPSRDVLVALAIWEALSALDKNAGQVGASLAACLNHAWHEIKDRTGRMVDGIFVKEEENA